MALAAEAGHATLLERVAEAIRESGRDDAAVTRFTEILFSEPAQTELDGYAAEALATLAMSAWDFAAQRAEGRHKIRTFNPERLDMPHGDVTVVEILNDDMPFLVDSIRGEILERGLAVHLVFHPILLVVRDDERQIQAVFDSVETDEAPEAAVKESYIHVHIERLESEEDLSELKRTLSDILDDVRTVVQDWKPMREQVKRSVAAYTSSPPPVPVSDLAESLQFLKWLSDNNFTFLGIRQMSFEGGAEEGQLVPVPDSGLGILRDPELRVLRRGTELVHMTPEIRNFFLAPAPLIIAKANVRARVHRRSYMDYIGVKIYAENGEISGELRIVGLFTSVAYTHSPKNIPFLRHKVDLVVRRSGYEPAGHSGKALMNVIDTYPRDELFQVDVNLLYEFAIDIMSLELKPRVRVYARIDEFDRFVSLPVYVPRDRYSTDIRKTIGDFLAETYNGRVSAYYPFFPEGPLVRIHFIIGRFEGKTPERDQGFLEKEILNICRTWEDRLKDVIHDRFEGPAGAKAARRYLEAFSPGYQVAYAPERAIQDIAQFDCLGAKTPVAVDFYSNEGDETGRVRVALYHLHGPIRLSRRVPILENLGFAVIDERSYRLRPQIEGKATEVSLHDMVLETRDGSAIDLAAHQERLEDCFLAVWNGAAANDHYNRLVLQAGLDWREAAAVRAYGAYLRQIRAPFGQAYLSDTLLRHTGVARELMALFRRRFDPAQTDGAAREEDEARIVESVEAALEEIPSLDEDRIIRHFLNLVRVTLRTNFYQRDEQGRPRETIAFKFDSAHVEGAPDPRPFAEIFVYSPRVEGIHLRGGRIARGGLRWSDRAQDFRTEVLGLAKAQQVKNTVIVPTGSKGGFVPKLLPEGGSRDEILEEGVAAYKLFVGSLLTITDNLQGNDTVPPADVVRHDGDDPYLVVAADKGTATLSDTANGISTDHGFWLGDAFASGGSAGYDHKKMGITARGGWEAVKRHFREMDIDIQATPFRVVGVGDMSGDVFGNGMLLSRQIELLAAFDHRDIFIDPDPDPAASWEERNRLFALPRSSWQDYDKSLIAKGGGVFSRSAKSIALTPEIKALTGLDKDAVPPNELLRALLRVEADLLWFGGIGTYVRASTETDDDAGDRANDALRVTAKELKVKVVGEGANLGITHRARIEFAMAGGRVNTDAIDNSAGVNSSDLEVNIKIALGQAVEAGKLDMAARNAFLAEMTEQVAEACLRNNYLQTLAVSLGEMRGLADMGFQARLMRELERSGLLDRELEFLPSDAEVAERQAAGQPMSRPELAVLLAYAKIDLFNELIASEVPDDPYFARHLMAYFPKDLQERYPDEIEGHRLRREIIATQLSNEVINRGGSTMFVRLKEETGHAADRIALAFTAAEAVFDLEPLNDEIDALDTRLSGRFQLKLYQRVQGLLRQQTAWFLRNAAFDDGLSAVIDLYRDGLKTVSGALEAVLTEDQRQRLADEAESLAAGGLSQELAQRIAALSFLADGPDIVHVAESTGQSVENIAKAFSEASAYFRLDEFRQAGESLGLTDYFDRLAINSTMSALSTAQRSVVQEVVRLCNGAAPRFEAWHESNRGDIERARQGIDEILDGGELTLSKLTVAVTHVRDLAPA